MKLKGKKSTKSTPRSTKKVGTTKPIRSTSKEAKRIIRSEIVGYHRDTDEYKSPLDGMKMNADGYNCGDNRYHTNYEKGVGYVEAGGLACYVNDQRKMLRKIYGKRVDDWHCTKVMDTYKHLIGREYSRMLTEREKEKAKKAQERAKAKLLKAAKAKEKKSNGKKKR